ncbi:ABC transporter substrate-binding protein [Rhodoferax lacus]|nr:helical backbone metal receptor [Rhodoferax lacus]
MACGALWMLSAWVAPALALEITDDRGTRVAFTQTPQRIVSLLPSLTETVCALDRCNLLVGVDRYSNFPQSVLSLPQLGGGMDPNVEGIVMLKPDVVLAAPNSRASERLRALGIPVLVFETKTHADVRRILEKLGQLLEVPDAQRVWRAIDAGVSAAAQSLPASVKKVRVYFEVNRGPFAAGESSFIGETLSRLGVKNIVPTRMGPFPRLNPEYVVLANPDLIMVGERNHAGMEGRPGWSHIRAIKDHRVCVFAVADSDLIVRPGPRMAQAARVMASCLANQRP